MLVIVAERFYLEDRLNLRRYYYMNLVPTIYKPEAVLPVYTLPPDTRLYSGNIPCGTRTGEGSRAKRAKNRNDLMAPLKKAT